jgi:cytochrome c biogenesis protein CcdA
MVTTVVLIVLNRINPDVHLSLVVLPVLPLVLHYVVVRRADRQRGPGSERPNIEPRRLHASLALVAFAVAAVTIGSSIMVGVWLAATSSSWTANASAWMWAGAATFALVIPAAIAVWVVNRRATAPSSENPSSAPASSGSPHDHRMV